MADLACMSASITIVPFFESLGSDGIAFILNQTEFSTLCCEKRFLPTILKQKKDGKINGVNNIISFDEVDDETK